jgi:hypothetical protein
MDNRIKKYAREFLNMKKGEKIANPQEIILVTRVARVTRRSLKHFIESRVEQGNSWDEIDYLLEKVGEIIKNPQLEILNPNQRNYPGSFLLGNFYVDKKKAVIVVLDREGGIRNIVTLYFAKKAYFFRLLNAREKNK